jgi:hypothetical protein
MIAIKVFGKMTSQVKDNYFINSIALNKEMRDVQ